ncbi:peroxiredoxin family protein [Nocardia huaxiensis]|uniref:thioredoxin-dependent peroxiredoxin n=1 Tax=Nocardia huaxiensis TaxID=2755382 RepID=A0A7D6VB61_9NOCA|nr:redoxin domain-containing protein [Nocardia huaxiensis]QLY27995.1 peroxiredoxin family protein [Nocardia huaxiensis]UFS98600.1 peroxiredoxin family protein [Nocardia huaxiensis]
MLTAGSRAPEMDFDDTAGRPWRLSDHRGKHSVLLYFVRATTCPVCTHHVRDLIAQQDALAADNIRVVIAVPEDRETASNWKAKRDIPFPVVVGRSARPHESIGLTRKVFGAMQQSGTVLVDAEGIVRHVQGSTLPTNGYDRKALTAAIDSMRGRAMA